MANTKLTLDHIPRLMDDVQYLGEELGINQEELQKRLDDQPEEHVLGVVMQLVREVLNKCFGDYDRENRKPGKLYTFILEELSWLLEMPVDELRTYDLDEVIELIEVIVDRERGRRLGKYVGRMISPFTSLISKAIAAVQTRIDLAILDIASPGGPESGGMTGLSPDFVMRLENFLVNWELSNSPEPLNSSPANPDEPS